jgi:hypothetical protein
MFTPKVYDLNIQTEARRKMQMEQVRKRILQTADFPTVVKQRMTSNFTAPNMGTPAYVQQYKEHQARLRAEAEMRNAPEM